MNRAEFRQWAMIYAMQGLLANPLNNPRSVPAAYIADWARRNADALLEASTIDEEAQ